LTENREKIRGLVDLGQKVIKPSKRQRLGASSLVFQKGQFKNLKLPDLNNSYMEMSTKTP
jgi:hypothetical protein